MKPKMIDLPTHGIQVMLVGDREMGGGTIVCAEDLHELCPHCGGKDCCFQCDDSTAVYSPADLVSGLDAHFEAVKKPDKDAGDENEDAVRSRLTYNGAVDGIMSMILAHAVAGIDIQSPAYLAGIETALQGAAENS